MLGALDSMEADGWLCRDALDMRQIVFQTPRIAHERAARSKQSHEVRDAATGLFDDFRPGCVVVRLPVGVVIVLIGIEVAVGVGFHDFPDGTDSAVGAFVSRCQDKLSPVCLQDALAFDRGIQRQAELDLITLCRADHGISDTGVAAGSVDQGLSRLELPRLFRLQNHVQGSPVLDGSAGIEILGFRVNFDPGIFGRNLCNPQQRCVPDISDQVIRHSHFHHLTIDCASDPITIKGLKRLLIRPGAIGDFIVSLPAMESLRGEYTEVWCAGPNVPLAAFADAAQSIVSAGLDRIGLLPDNDVMERLREFDSIISWYGASNNDFRESVRELPFEFLPALPSGDVHAVDFYNRQAIQAGGVQPSRFPVIRCPNALRSFAVIHPFASSFAKRAPMQIFESVAQKLSQTMPVHWLCGPEERLDGAVHIDNLFELACWLRQARIFVGNDSGISHLAAAVGTPVLALFTANPGVPSPRVWAPRGPASYWISSPEGRRESHGELPALSPEAAWT